MSASTRLRTPGPAPRRRSGARARGPGFLVIPAMLLFGLAACLPSPPPLCGDDEFSVRQEGDPCPPPPTTPGDPLPPPSPPPPACEDCGGITGDPHVLTFDRGRYDLQAAGELVAVASGDLEIQVRLEPRGTTVSSVTAVAMQVDGVRFTVTPGDSGSVVRVDGEVVELTKDDAIPLGDGRSAVGADGSIVVEWPDGSLAVVDAGRQFSDLLVGLAPERRGGAQGLLGDADGDPENDLVTSDGELIDPDPEFDVLYDVYAESWRVTDETSLFDYEDGESTDTFTDRDFPPARVTLADLDPADRAAAEEICREAGVTDPGLLDACILDVALTGDAAYAESAARAQRRQGATASVGSGDGSTWIVTLDDLEAPGLDVVADDAGHVFASGRLDGDGVLVALHGDDGTEAWRVAGTEESCPALPLGDGRIAVVGVAKGPLADPDNPSASLVILDADTGEALGAPALTDPDDDGPRFSPCRHSSTRAGDTALFSTANAVWAWDVSGTVPTLRWSMAIKRGNQYLAVVDDTVVIPTATASDDATEALLVDVETGDVLDRVDLPGFRLDGGDGNTVVEDDRVVLTTLGNGDDDNDGYLVGLQVDGDELSVEWTLESARDGNGSLPGRTHSLTSLGELVVGHTPVGLAAFDLRSGDLEWLTHPGGFRNTSSPASAGPDGTLYDGIFGGPFVVAIDDDGEVVGELVHDDVFDAGSPVGPALTFGPVVDGRVIIGAAAANTPVIAAIDVGRFGGDPDGPDEGASGEWDTTAGDMQIDFGATSVTATYEAGDSTVEGSFDGTILDGTWAEPSSARECDSEVRGTPYWGQVLFAFDDDLQTFEGRWGYCEDPPDRTWNGERNP